MSTPYPPQPPGSPVSGNPYPGAAGGSAIALTTKFFPLAWLFYFFKPFIAVDGHQLPNTSWGRTVIPVAPGEHHLHVHTPYLLPSQLGKADAMVPVAPGQTVELEYRTPIVIWEKGALGAPPQKYNGMWFMWVMLGIVALIIVCCCGSTLLGGLSGSSGS